MNKSNRSKKTKTVEKIQNRKIRHKEKMILKEYKDVPLEDLAEDYIHNEDFLKPKWFIAGWLELEEICWCLTR